MHRSLKERSKNTMRLWRTLGVADSATYYPTTPPTTNPHLSLQFSSRTTYTLQMYQHLQQSHCASTTAIEPSLGHAGSCTSHRPFICTTRHILHPTSIVGHAYNRTRTRPRTRWLRRHRESRYPLRAVVLAQRGQRAARARAHGMASPNLTLTGAEHCEWAHSHRGYSCRPPALLIPRATAMLGALADCIDDAFVVA